VVTITNDDALPQLTINNITLVEGNTGTANAVLTVSLSAASALPVSVNWATANGTASAPSDYLANSGTLTLATGQTTGTITVVVNGDTLNEADETFFVNLSNAANATISDAQGVVTIRNDDANVPPTVSLTNPTNGAIFSATADILISAIAADRDGSVAKVEFLQGNTKLGESAASPYTITWTNVAAGTYTLTARATDNLGAITTSSPVTITVNQAVFPPRIIVQPQSQDVFVGAPVIFTVQATGSQPLLYQWRFNGVNITGATTDTLRISQAQLTDAGTYTVVVSNVIGSDTSLPAILTVSNWRFETGSWIRSSPALAPDGTIYFGSADTKLYALDPMGNKKWAFATGSSIESSPALGADGTIYFGSWDSKLYALNPDGTEKWSFLAGDLITSSPAISTNGTIYFGSGDGNLYALNPDGTEQWNFTTGSGVYSSPSIGADGAIYFGSYDDKLYALNTNGTKRWEFTTAGAIFSSPAIGTNGVIYFGSDDGRLYAVNTNGLKRWEYKTGAEVISSPTIASDGTIYVGSFDNNLYAFNPDGTKRWQFATSDAIFSSPAIGADGTIYVGSLDSTFYAVNPDGTQRWTFTVGDGIESSPALGPDGTIYFGSYDHYLYTVPGDGPLANTPWAMFRHDLQHTGSVQAAPSTGNSALRPAHYGADTQSNVGQQNQPGEISVGTAALIRSQPSLNIARQVDGTLGIEVRGEIGRRYVIQTSSNLVDWTVWVDFVSDEPSITFEESRVTNGVQRFYRIVAP